MAQSIGTDASHHSTDRSLALDSAKFFLIALVPICHLIEYGGGTPLAAAIHRWILLFNMPAFAMLSGAVTTRRSTTLSSITATLILPYLLFQTLYSLFHAWVFHTGHWLPGYVTPYWILWYLVSLACWRMLLPLAEHLRWPICLSVLIALLAGMLPDIGYAFSLSRTLVFFPLFLIGRRLGPGCFETLAQRRGAWLVALVLLVAAGFAAWRHRGLPYGWLLGSVGYASLHASAAHGVLTRLTILIEATVCAFASILLAGRAAHWFGAWPARAGRRCMAPFLLHGFLIRGTAALGGFTYAATHVRGEWRVLLCVVLGLALTIVLSSAWVSHLIKPMLYPTWLVRWLFAPDATATVHGLER